MPHKQQGFTLIELVMVIVILGVLAAVALPKFANLSQDARIASLKTVRGAVISAVNMIHSKALIEGKESLASATIDAEGSTIAITYGYPSIGTNASSSIRDAAGLDPSQFYVISGFAGGKKGIVLVMGDTYSTSCGFAYTDATATSPPVVAALPTHPFLVARMCK